MLSTHSSQQNWLLLIYFTTGIPRYHLNYDSTYKPTQYEVDGYTLNSNIIINIYILSTYTHPVTVTRRDITSTNHSDTDGSDYITS